MPVTPQETRTYFVTAYCTGRRKVFADTTAAELMVSVIRDNHQLGRMSIHAYVVMPDHVHVLLTLTPEVPLERAMQFLRGRFSMLRMARESVWDRLFRKDPVNDAQTFRAFLRALEENPARSGLVSAAEDYPYSSVANGMWMAPMPVELAVARPEVDLF
jgi:putative transposase